MSEAFPLLARLKALPRPFDVEKSRWALKELHDVSGSADLAAFLRDPRATALLTAVFGNSPYLTRLILRDPEILPRLLRVGPEAALDELIAELQRHCRAATELATIMKVLRVAKTHMALLVALADIGGAWPLETVTGALTKFADACVQAALRFALGVEAAAARLKLKHMDDPESESGFIVIAMGKYGAAELNYSSDIDLIVFFDKESWPVTDSHDAQSVAVRVTQIIVKALSEQTSDGYVFRTDLRLRPDAGATQIALSTEAAESYYESLGQNWERAAMIKARVCAGDRAAGARFMEELRPFLWRRHLDFAAIEDIHSIKRQIQHHKGHRDVAVAGHNLKLGRGGIREIEFFVQTQQLILGGREPSLRGRTTCGMLATLAEKGFVTAETAAELTEAYILLRTIEHRLQMIEDAQTHTLPKDAHGLDHIAAFCGAPDMPSFERLVMGTLTGVQRHYAALFENAPSLGAGHGSLVFTGVDDDAETLENLEQMGFKRAREVSAIIRGWHHGRLRATRSARARELLTNLVPPLLRAMATSGDPDAAFFRFHGFLEHLPAGVQLFSLLLQNQHLLDVLVALLASAPRLARTLGRDSAILDSFLDPEYLTLLPGPEELTQRFHKMLTDARDFQDALDHTRRWAREEKFRVGVHVLFNTADAEEAGRAYVDIAECVLRGLLPATVNEFVARHGRLADGAFAIVAMGKFGGHEMTATSDLDLVFLYDAPNDAVSRGLRGLQAPDYYARLSQRVINALTAQTATGGLYAVDMRLRPSGNAGPIATRLASFERYHVESAWTWEHMALTRARVVAGDAALCATVRGTVDKILVKPRDPAKTARDVVDMRARVLKEYPSQDPWELKYVRGGLVDLEFTAQYLALVHAASHPEILSTNTHEMLMRLGEAGAIPTATARKLAASAEVLHAVLQILRVAVEGPFKPDEAPAGLAAALARALDAPVLSSAEAVLVDAQQAVYELYRELVEGAV